MYLREDVCVRLRRREPPTAPSTGVFNLNCLRRSNIRDLNASTPVRRPCTFKEFDTIFITNYQGYCLILFDLFAFRKVISYDIFLKMIMAAHHYITYFSIFIFNSRKLFM